MSQNISPYEADAIGRINLLFKQNFLWPGGTQEDTVSYLLELFQDAQSVADALHVFEKKGSTDTQFFKDGKILDLPTAVRFCLGENYLLSCVISFAVLRYNKFMFMIEIIFFSSISLARCSCSG